MKEEIKKRGFMIIILFLIISLFVYFRVDEFAGSAMVFAAIIIWVLVFIYARPSSGDTYSEKITGPVKEKEEKESKRKKIMLIIAIIFAFLSGLFIYIKLNDLRGIAIMIFGPIGLIIFSIQINAASKLTEDDRKKVFQYMKDNDPSKLPDKETLKRYKTATGGYLMSNKRFINFELNPKKQLYWIYFYIISISFLAIYEYLVGEKQASAIFFGVALIMFVSIRFWYKRVKEGRYPLTNEKIL